MCSIITVVLAEVAHVAQLAGGLAWSPMSGALVLAVSWAPCFFSTRCLWGQGNLRWCLLIRGLGYAAWNSRGCPCISLPRGPSTWLTWASSQHGQVRIVRLHTWRVKPVRACVPRSSGKSYKDSDNPALEILPSAWQLWRCHVKSLQGRTSHSLGSSVYNCAVLRSHHSIEWEGLLAKD